MIAPAILMPRLFCRFSLEGAPIDFPGQSLLAAVVLVSIPLVLFARATRVARAAR